VEERLDLSIFDERYSNDETGRKAIAPEVLIKVVLFGYSRGMITSRSLSGPSISAMILCSASTFSKNYSLLDSLLCWHSNHHEKGFFDSLVSFGN
jgi:transposase